MILLPGTHTLTRPDAKDVPFLLDWASASALAPTTIEVWRGAELIERCYIGPSSPHTWWSNNPLLIEKQYPGPGETITIIVGASAVMRIEVNSLCDTKATA